MTEKGIPKDIQPVLSVLEMVDQLGAYANAKFDPLVAAHATTPAMQRQLADFLHTVETRYPDHTDEMTCPVHGLPMRAYWMALNAGVVLATQIAVTLEKHKGKKKVDLAVDMNRIIGFVKPFNIEEMVDLALTKLPENKRQDTDVTH